VSWGQGSVCALLECRSSAVVLIENPALGVLFDESDWLHPRFSTLPFKNSQDLPCRVVQS